MQGPNGKEPFLSFLWEIKKKTEANEETMREMNSVLIVQYIPPIKPITAKSFASPNPIPCLVMIDTKGLMVVFSI